MEVRTQTGDWFPIEASDPKHAALLVAERLILPGERKHEVYVRDDDKCYLVRIAVTAEITNIQKVRDPDHEAEICAILKEVRENHRRVIDANKR